MQGDYEYSYKLKNIGFNLSLHSLVNPSNSSPKFRFLPEIIIEEDLKDNTSIISQLKKDLSTDTISITNKNTHNEENDETISDSSHVLTDSDTSEVTQQFIPCLFNDENKIPSGSIKGKKIIIKAFRSKLKMNKEYIYKHNSLVFKELTKDKIFHKCNFPGCKRTFASSGWLKAHLVIHDNEIFNQTYNRIFKSIIKPKE